MSVKRLEFRARLKSLCPDIDEKVLQLAKEQVSAAIARKDIMTLGLYQWGRQLFLYVEALTDQGMDPETVLPAMSPLLSSYPHGEEDRLWAYMYPIFYHAIPDTESSWQRAKPECRVGRIALLRHDRLFDYVMHHRALVNEGALQGDRYQFISLHEDMLFSYFEEPRTYVNLKNDPSVRSTCIDAWTAAVPEAHFQPLPGCGGQNFLILPELICMGSND